MSRTELEIDFSTFGEPDRSTYENLCNQFALFFALNGAVITVTDTKHFKQFRNAIVMGGGRCESTE